MSTPPTSCNHMCVPLGRSRSTLLAHITCFSEILDNCSSDFACVPSIFGSNPLSSFYPRLGNHILLYTLHFNPFTSRVSESMQRLRFCTCLNSFSALSRSIHGVAVEQDCMAFQCRMVSTPPCMCILFPLSIHALVDPLASRCEQYEGGGLGTLR